MATKLFVGSLPYTTTSDQLSEIFSKAGKVTEANVVTDKMTGRSRGFGFVEMASEEDAKKAIDTLNGTEVEGRKIFVSEARPPRQDNSSPKSQSPGPEPAGKEEPPAEDQ